ncbi:hypothetical protein PRIPAC_95516 [Pristionchus pacificus]|uniref:Uncharacterized protein n=1 Tax=Pristionchus pacificus TaxID=54126 RepID=A0A2A6BJR4_PRIPA|nr:hypothetical protein PRIPAC_95516 [Pristionchus pacificus]|eukprot:PDM66078.1 hypothetical protein PRIPAC_45303 [Pristionchus pacificus]
MIVCWYMMFSLVLWWIQDGLILGSSERRRVTTHDIELSIDGAMTTILVDCPFPALGNFLLDCHGKMCTLVTDADVLTGRCKNASNVTCEAYQVTKKDENIDSAEHATTVEKIHDPSPSIAFLFLIVAIFFIIMWLYSNVLQQLVRLYV